MSKVSVIIASYNHENYIEECIQSVLNQTFNDFEIIIIDDNSTDKTVDVIKKFEDSRIILIEEKKNNGQFFNTNKALRQANGDYIAILNSDDVWEADKLELQCKVLNEKANVGAVFTYAKTIDDNSKHIKNKLERVFAVKNKTRHEWLRYFFNGDNCLCHPSLLIRKKAHDELGLYNHFFMQVADLDFWTRLCLHYEIKIIEKPLTKFRIRANEANASGQKPSVRIRFKFELKEILNNFLNIQNKDEFLKIFPDSVNYGKVENKAIPYFLARMALESDKDYLQQWGIETLYKYITSNENLKFSEEKYNFSYMNFIKITGQFDTFNVAKQKVLLWTKLAGKKRLKLLVEDSAVLS